MRRYFKLITLVIFMINALNGLGQTDRRDFLYKWQNNKGNMWISIDSTFQKFTPTIDELKMAKELSIKYIDSLEQMRSPTLQREYGKILKFKHRDYYRQYLGYIDENGDRIVLLNACCSVSPSKQYDHLDTNWIFVLDGGSCYFQIKIDLKTKKCFGFSVNGEA